MPEHLAARGCDADLAVEQGLRGRPAQRNDDARFEHRNLPLQERQTGSNFCGVWRAVQRRTTFDRVGDVHILTSTQTQRSQQRIEQFAGLADEGLTPLILLGPRAFTDEQPAPLPVADTWHHPLIALEAGDFLVLERSGAAVDCELAQLADPVRLAWA